MKPQMIVAAAAATLLLLAGCAPVYYDDAYYDGAYAKPQLYNGAYDGAYARGYDGLETEGYGDGYGYGEESAYDVGYGYEENDGGYDRDRDGYREANYGRYERDGRDQGVPRDVSEQHPELADPLRPDGCDEVRVEHLDHPDAQRPDEDRHDREAGRQAGWVSTTFLMRSRVVEH